MVTAKESQMCHQFSAWRPPDLDRMTVLQLEKNRTLPCFPPTTFVFPGQHAHNVHDLNRGQQDAVVWSKYMVTPHRDMSCPHENTYLKDPQCALPNWLGGTDKPADASYAPEKRFVIFDKSGNHTRLFLGPSVSPCKKITASKTASIADGLCEKLGTKIDQFLVKPNVKENGEESDVADEEGEMHEDTGDIDALLYSSADEFENDCDTDGENDEVTSTLHSPLSLGKSYDKDKLLEELVEEEVASSDDPPKRQKVLDGGYKSSSLVSVEHPVKLSRTSSCNFEDDVGSSCIGSKTCYYDDIKPSKREKKVKIRNALKVLESIIPGLKSNDSLSIIDNAIIYLKSMKTEAEAHGLGYPESDSATFS